MKAAVKWLVWVGALAVLASFFLPSVQKPESGPVSLFELAHQPAGQLLFAVAAGAALIILLGLIAERRRGASSWWHLGQALALAISELGVVAASLQTRAAVSLSGFVGAPGSLLLAIGYLVIIVGLFIGIFVRQTSVFAVELSSGTRLELLRGDVPSPGALKGSEFTIGRSRQNQLMLRERIVSGVHARLRQANGEWFIQDQDSSNGTFVNDRKIQAQRLRDGDRIRIGSTVFVFRWHAESHAILDSR